MTREQLQDKCRGSLVGGAVGDALGYEVEFMNLAAIRNGLARKESHVMFFMTVWLNSPMILR